MFVIVSKKYRGFWSNSKGWTPNAECATQFPAIGAEHPLSPDSEWLAWEVAKGHSFLCQNIECGKELEDPALVCPHCAMPIPAMAC